MSSASLGSMVNRGDMPAARRNATATRILDVALRLVQVRGYNAFSYADISAELRITKASLHHHFRTKAELGTALVSGYRRDFLAALDEIDRRGGDAPAKLAAYAALYLQVLRADRMCLCGILAADFETLPKAMRREVTEFFRANEVWLTGIFEHGRLAGTLRFDGDPGVMACVVLSSLEGALLVARSYGGVRSFEAVVKKLLDGLRVRS